MPHETAAAIRAQVWTASMRRDYLPDGPHHVCPCEWGPCGHCKAGRHGECTHERHPDYAARPAPETRLVAPPGVHNRIAEHPVWLVGRACSWTCPCLTTHQQRPEPLTLF